MSVGQDGLDSCRTCLLYTSISGRGLYDFRTMPVAGAIASGHLYLGGEIQVLFSLPDECVLVQRKGGEMHQPDLIAAHLKDHMLSLIHIFLTILCYTEYTAHKMGNARRSSSAAPSQQERCFMNSITTRVWIAGASGRLGSALSHRFGGNTDVYKRQGFIARMKKVKIQQ